MATEALMRCLKQTQVDSKDFPQLSKRITELKSTEGGLTAVCEVMKKYEDIVKAEERKTIARKMIASGIFTDEQVSEFTGLTIKEVTAIRNGSAAYILINIEGVVVTLHWQFTCET